MKTKNKQKKNKNRTEKIGTKIIALAIITLFMFSMIPSFVFALPDSLVEVVNVAKSLQNPLEGSTAETMARVKRTEDLVTSSSILPPASSTVITRAEGARGVPISPDELPKTREEVRDLRKKAGNDGEGNQDEWDLGSLVPCSGTGGIFDCVLDITTTTISVIWGVGMGINLVRIKGSCSAEEQLKGLTPSEQEEACKSCNADPLRLCTLDRCLILGNCIPVEPEEGTPEEMSNFICIPGKCEETGTVGFESVDVIFYSGGQELAEHKYENKDIPLTLTKQVPFNSDSVNIEIKTDKLAMCRYSFEAQQDYDSMIDFDDNYYPGTYDEPENQDVTIMLPGTMPRNQQHTVYIKCSNVCGVVHDKNDDNHFVKFTFEEKPDQLPPIIVAMDPPNMGAVSGDLISLKVEFELDEEGYCKFSDNWTLDANDNPAPLTTGWEEMVRFDDNAHYGGSAVTNGYCTPGACQHLRDPNKCSHCFLDLNLNRGYTEYNWEQLSPELQEELGLEDTVKFFHYKIRCADEKENKMPEEDTLDYSFFVVPPYEMELIKPEDYSYTYEINPEIEVTSSRRTNCRYEVLKQEQCKENYPEWEDMIDIDGTFDKEHFGEVKEDLLPSIQGTPYCIYVKCRDMWQLERKDNAFFKLFQDVTNPKIIRMYHDIFAGDYLLIETDEDATCVYGIDDEIKCNYAFNEGTEMTGTNSTIHTAYWSLDHLYYIRCQDQWGNKPSKGTCTAIINPFEIPTIPF